MQSKAKSVTEYLSELSDERRLVLEQVREMILANLQDGFEEGMQYGMIGYYVPHSIFPSGYHCNPEEPLPLLALASQKNYCSFYAMSLYSDKKELARFEAAWKATGKKLDMGKSCIRFKKASDLAMEVLAKHIAAISVADYVASYEKATQQKSPKK